MSDVINRLDQALMDIHAPDAAHEEGFHIESDDQAAWVSRKLAATHKELARIDAWKEREQQRIEEVAATERARHERDKEWWESLLHTYLHQLVLEGRTKKSMDLPGGTIKLRKRQPAIHFEDREAVIEFLRHVNPNLIRTREDINLAEFRKHIQVEGTTVVLAETGDVLEDVLVEEQGDSLSFTPAEEGE